MKPIDPEAKKLLASAKDCLVEVIREIHTTYAQSARQDIFLADLLFAEKVNYQDELQETGKPFPRQKD
ncbi:hypothetical protein ACVWYN_001682 [Pedobacter sp. UYP24]